MKILTFSFLYAVLMCAGCGMSDINSIDLPNKYHLVMTSGSEAVVCTPGPGNEVVLGPNIKSYAIYGRFVVGYEKREAYPDAKLSFREGYFILNTSSGNIQNGLRFEDWQKHLQTVGINSPDLKKP